MKMGCFGVATCGWVAEEIDAGDSHGLAKAGDKAFEFEKVRVHHEVLEVDLVLGSNVVSLHVFDNVAEDVWIPINVHDSACVFFSKLVEKDFFF